jgi:phage terminase large subunit
MTSPSSSSTQQRLEIKVPRAFLPLLKPARYKGAYGGRGGAKSHFFAEQAIIRAYAKPMRIVCIREVQKSIRDSVRQLLIDKIAKLGLTSYYEPLETEIRGANGSLIIFRGMQSYNSDTIKSLEGYDVAWIEEAQTFSSISLELLRPTIRKPGSEIWAGWNPRNRTDAVDMFFRKNPHPDAVSVLVNWRDNPWFPDVLRREMEHDKATDPDTAEHVWEGGYGLQAGAILGRWVSAAEKEQRIHADVVYDPNGPAIEISSDLGWRDTSAWWFWQRRVGGFALLDFDQDSGLEASEWIERLERRLAERGWPLGKFWLPHDARTKTFLSKHSAIEQFGKHFGSARCGIVEATSKADRINAARTIIKRCEFHAERCEDGLNALRAWQYEYNPDLQVFTKEPLHDWASHPSDGFSYGCQVMQGLTAQTIDPEKQHQEELIKARIERLKRAGAGSDRRTGK